MKKKRFVAGDVLECIDNKNARGVLKKGDKYTFGGYIIEDGTEFIWVENEHIEGAFFAGRFKKIN